MHCEHTNVVTSNAWVDGPVMLCRECNAHWSIPDFITMRAEQAVADRMNVEWELKRGQGEGVGDRAPSPEDVQESEFARARLDEPSVVLGSELLESVRSVVRKFADVGGREGMVELFEALHDLSDGLEVLRDRAEREMRRGNMRFTTPDWETNLTEPHREPPIFVPSDDGESSSTDLATPIRMIIWRHFGSDDRYALVTQATHEIEQLIAQHLGSAYDKGSSDSDESPIEGTP